MNKRLCEIGDGQTIDQTIALTVTKAYRPPVLVAAKPQSYLAWGEVWRA